MVIAMTEREKFDVFFYGLVEHAMIGDKERELMFIAWQAAISSFQLPDRMDYDLEGDTVINSHHNTWADGYNQCLSDVISMNEEYSESAAPEVK